MYKSSLRWQSYISVGVILLVCVIMFPTILNMFGFSVSDNSDESKLSVERSPESLKSSPAKPSQSASKRSGILSSVLPVYALGIVLYFSYTVFTLLIKRKQDQSAQSDMRTRDYFRSFRHHDGKLSSSFSDEHESDTDRVFAGKHLDRFDWARAYGGSNKRRPSDPCDSDKELPRDLEYLLKKVDDDTLDDAEVHRLRRRLEEVEKEMERLLLTVNPALHKNEKSQFHSPSHSCKSNSNSSCNCDDELFSVSGSDLDV